MAPVDNGLGDPMGTTSISISPAPIQKPFESVPADPKKSQQTIKAATEKWAQPPWPPVMESPAVVRDAFAVWSLFQ